MTLPPLLYLTLCSARNQFRVRLRRLRQPRYLIATVLNRLRQPMRTIEPMAERWGTITQFDLPLAGLAPGEYTLRISVNGPSGSVAEHVTFKVLG